MINRLDSGNLNVVFSDENKGKDKEAERRNTTKMEFFQIYKHRVWMRNS